MLDTKVMAQIAETHFSPVVVKEFGQMGSQVLREMLEFLRNELFKYVDVELYSKQIVVFKNIGKANPLSLKSSTVLPSVKHLAQDFKKGFVLQILEQGGIRIWRNTSVNIKAMSQKALVYVYHNRSDRFVAKGKVGRIPNPDPHHASVFAIPTFDSLVEALMFYKLKRANNSACKILVGVWFEEARLFFATVPRKPEEVMRDSLSEFLKAHLRGDIDVHPEHNVNETEPVDVRVQWLFSKSQGLIEIKWMGKSKSPKGTVTATHGPSRARKGAKRLAEYLEEEKMQTPTNALRGYLVVIDGRRWGLKRTDTSIDSRKGLYYQNSEVKYSPEYHKIRDDFEEPIRMFVAPKLDV